MKDYYGYTVFSDGTILNKDGSRKILWKSYKGYMITNLRVNGRNVCIAGHRIVGLAFLPNPENLAEIDHINGIRDDNRVENLRWVSHSENVYHSYSSGRRNVRGVRNANCKHTEDQIHLICQLLQETNMSLVDVAKEAGVTKGVVNMVSRRKQWTAISADYKWLQRSETRPQGRRCEVASKQETP